MSSISLKQRIALELQRQLIRDNIEKVEVPLVWQEESQDGWKVGIFAADDVKVMLDPVDPSAS